MENTIKSLLGFMYGENEAEGIYTDLAGILETAFPGRLARAAGRNGRTGAGFTRKDAVLIAYGDMLAPPQAGGAAGETGLSRLEGFLRKWNQGAFTCLHLLPFHPYSSDDGFSVIDYRKVDSRFGTWGDIERLGADFKLVFDFVLNHGSVGSPWFTGFLNGESGYEGWYIVRPEGCDSSAVVRPRTHPLLTPFTRKDGSTVYVWTTFSSDQADYDFSNPRVLLEFMKIFLEYARRGARIVRLDAIAYLWKEDGTPCLHHPKTHAVVKLFRAVIDALDLDLLILTETNVPHQENISYFGQGDEAHLVYNFALPPLVLHAMISAGAAPLRAWAKTLPGPETGQRFLNFLASHDGVGLTPVRGGLVDEAAFGETIAEAARRGALVSYKSTPQGLVPYELNCSYADAAAPPSLGDPALRSRAFLASQAVLLSLSGLPAVYFHSWIGSSAWKEGPELLGYNRAINREKPPLDRVERELNAPGSFRARVYGGFSRLLAFRRAEEAFDPDVPQTVLEAGGSVFALLRGPDRRGRFALCAENLGPGPAICGVPAQYGFPEAGVSLAPWETRWTAWDPGDGAASIQELSTAARYTPFK
ncbi:MAG: sugar phosphorylase [Spirochaetaceae bacterium]|jgi:sucrose phosphorylase|nr:sugar phosphorylase [Spirochaetaceae bacterium]